MEIRRSFKDFYAQASWRIWVGIKYMVSELVLLSVSLGIEEKSFLGVMFRSFLTVFAAIAWFYAISGIALINFFIFLMPIFLFYEFIIYFVGIVGPYTNQSIIQPLRSLGISEAILVESMAMLLICILMILLTYSKRRHLMKIRQNKRFVQALFGDLLFDQLAQYNLSTFCYSLLVGTCKGIIISGFPISLFHSVAYPGSQWYWWGILPFVAFGILLLSRICIENSISRMRLIQNANTYFTQAIRLESSAAHVEDIID